MCRRNGTNCGQTMPKKWIIHCIHSLVSFFGFSSPPSHFCPVPQNHEHLGGMTCFVGRALSWGTDSVFFMPSTYPFLKNLALDTFGTHHWIPYAFPTLSPLRQRYFFKFSQHVENNYDKNMCPFLGISVLLYGGIVRKKCILKGISKNVN